MDLFFKPLTLGEIFETAYCLLKKHYKPLFTISGVAVAPFYLIFLAVFSWLAPKMAQDPYWFATIPAWLPFFVLVMITLFFMAIYVSGAALIRAVGALYLKEGPDLQKSYLPVFAKFWPFLWTVSIAGGLTFLGMLFFVVPGVLLHLAFFVVVPVVLFESLAGAEALKRSNELMKGEKLKAFLFFFILCVLSVVIDGILGLIPAVFLSALLKSVFQFLFVTFANVGIAVFYIQAKASKEALNAEEFAKLMGGI
ncbi:MAG: hypothetical protein Q8P84_06020 [Deltaproteobacteria bacterium]|nr:hypothetical protein [Deltaproteobacteria bacterium]MDZ4224384.1 hypothetical protein [bacterium]